MNQKLARVICVASVTAFCVFVGSGPARRQQNARSDQREKTHRMGNPPAGDEAFVRKAAEGNLAEVKLGQLAEEKGQSDEVKKFGKRVVEDHTKALDELKPIASQKNINLPAGLNRKDSQTYESLSKLSGETFDRAYAREMVRDHERT